MRAKFEKNKGFKDDLIKFFERNRKSSWGKNQVVTVIKDLWIKHLELLVEDKKEKQNG